MEQMKAGGQKQARAGAAANRGAPRDGFSVVGRPLLALPRCVPLLHGWGEGSLGRVRGGGAEPEPGQPAPQAAARHDTRPRLLPRPAPCRKRSAEAEVPGREGGREGGSNVRRWLGSPYRPVWRAPPQAPSQACRQKCMQSPPVPPHPTPPHPLRCGTNSSTHPLVNQVLVLLQVGRGADEQDAKHRHVQQHLAKEAVLLVQQAHACGGRRGRAGAGGRAGERGVPCTGPLLPFPCRPPV